MFYRKPAEAVISLEKMVPKPHEGADKAQYLYGLSIHEILLFGHNEIFFPFPSCLPILQEGTTAVIPGVQQILNPI